MNRPAWPASAHLIRNPRSPPGTCGATVNACGGLLGQVAVNRQTVQCCEQQLCYPGPHTLAWPRSIIAAQQILGALALPYKLHPAWQEAWRP
jgi:hypothetical protein